MELYKPNYQTTDRIGLTEIIFENNPNETSVTIEGFIYNPKNDWFIPTSFSCEFEMLTTILISDFDNCEKIIVAIQNELSKEISDKPVIIDVTEYYKGSNLLISELEINYYRPFTQNEDGEWHEVPKNEEYYIIDHVTSSWAKKNPEIIELRKDLDKQYSILNLAYTYYLRLVAQNYSEKKARKLAGLNNEILFRITFLKDMLGDYEDLTKTSF
jgi:hypothetical protein